MQAGLRRLVASRKPAAALRRDYGISYVRERLERSLRNLKTEFVDLFFLHEPVLAQIANPDALTRELHALKAQGKIRYFGLAGRGRDCAEIARLHPGLAEVLQIDADRASGGVDAIRDVGHEVGITFGHLRSVAARLRSQSERQHALRDAIAAAIGINPLGVLLFSATSCPHIDEVVKTLAAAERSP
jgi:hypothetical protein